MCCVGNECKIRNRIKMLFWFCGRHEAAQAQRDQSRSAGRIQWPAMMMMLMKLLRRRAKRAGASLESGRSAIA
jgi:hypothetical protein